ncbi:adenosine receptor A2a-like [Diadema antillarum]|uniref:adenosine receptor A2a-like n=1 Tax=Diadema antillarum TaxID=105358 RepID=UPI003A8718D9
MVTITLDRYIAITRPLRYLSIVTFKRVSVVIVFTWMTCIAFFVTRSYLIASKHTQVITIKCPGIHFEDPYLRAVNLIVLVGSTLAFLVLTGINVRILRISFKQSRVIFQATEAIGRNQGNHEISIKNLKGAQNICIIVFIFILCWVPTQIVFGLELSPLSEHHFPVLAEVMVISMAINSAVNPLIYGYRDRLFREAFNEFRNRLMTLIF